MEAIKTEMVEVIKIILVRLKKMLFPSEFDKAINRWFADEGDRTLRLDYPLSRESVVFDLGGYIGQYTSDIYSKYLCKCYVFEPVQEYYDHIQKRFARNDRIQVCPFGLADKNESCSININNDGSSIYKKSGANETDGYENIDLMNIDDFMKRNEIDHIDLMKINIEGGEYDLLDYILHTGLINIIDNLQIQFHDIKIKGGAQNRMHSIQSRLEKTHDLTWNYRPFVWENWQKKKRSGGSVL